MKKNKKRLKTPSVKLTVIFTATYGAILFATVLLVAAICTILFFSPAFGKKALPNYSFTVIYVIITVVIGVLLSFLFSRIILSPLDELIMALSRVADRDYSAKVTPHGIRRARILGRRFNIMTQELHGITIMNEDFANNFLHELKTPVTSILGFARLLKDDGIPQDKRDEYLDIIIDESERLAAFSTNTLLFSKLSKNAKTLEYENYNVTEQIRRTVTMMENKWSAKNITPELEGDDITADGDREILSHVWINLLDNAIKFTGEGGHIVVTAQRRDESFIASIRDDGIGMDEKTVKKIFDQYYQADESHSVAGNGLGMPIVRKAVELHGGSVDVRSEPGQGTEITVTLPLGRPE